MPVGITRMSGSVDARELSIPGLQEKNGSGGGAWTPHTGDSGTSTDTVGLTSPEGPSFLVEMISFKRSLNLRARSAQWPTIG